MEAPEDGAGDQPQLDRASSNEPRPIEPTAVGDDQAETIRPTTPTRDTAVSSDPSNCSLGCLLAFILSALKSV